jgi:hypothetical protein
MEDVCTHYGLARLDPLEGCEVAFSVRLGSTGAENHAMRLRFGPAGYDGTVTGHLLCDIGTSRHVVHDAVVWDHALDDFVLGDVAALNRLAELLDLTTSLFGGTGRFLEGTVEIVLDLLRGLLTPGFLVIGGIGAVFLFYSFYYLLLAALAQWAFWWVVVPSLVGLAVCLGIHRARLSRLHDAVLAAARSALAASSPTPWSQT